MDDTLKTLRSAVAARNPAPRPSPAPDAHREPLPSPPTASAGRGAAAAPAMPGDRTAPHGSAAPAPEQILLFDSDPRPPSDPNPPSGGTTGIDAQTAALMEAYERGAWPPVDGADAVSLVPGEPTQMTPATNTGSGTGTTSRAGTGTGTTSRTGTGTGTSSPTGTGAGPGTGAGMVTGTGANTGTGAAAAKDGVPSRPQSASPATGRAPNLTAGHRARLRQRFDHGERLADYELLELLLFRALPRRDTKPIAKALIQRFGTFAAAVAAPPERLQDIDGIGPAVVTDFRLVRAAAERFAFDDLKKRPVLSSTDAVVRYYRTQLRTAEREEFHVLFLDKKNKFLASECLGVGTVDHTPVYPRELMKRALGLSATAIILVHNHPSGDPTPSRADVAMTQKIVEAASTLTITVHDHLIVAEDGYTSLRAEELM